MNTTDHYESTLHNAAEIVSALMQAGKPGEFQYFECPYCNMTAIATVRGDGKVGLSCPSGCLGKEVI